MTTTDETTSETKAPPHSWKISPELAAHLEAKKLAAVELEEMYVSRGLKFTQGFTGSFPVQAYGIIDGYRFYFRYRGDNASIRIGFIADDRLVKEHARDMAFYNKRIEKYRAEAEATGVSLESIMSDRFEREPLQETLNGITDYPSSIRKQSYLSGFYGEDYKGELEPEECKEIFIRLIESLEEVEYEDPLTIP